MQELDRAPSQPVPEISPVVADECGMPPVGEPPMGMPPKQDIPPPSLSVNINAQGMDNIKDIMSLWQKVNPDMVPPVSPMPSIGPIPSITAIKPELPPLKPLPDFDADNDEMPGGELDMMKLDLDKGDDEKRPKDDEEPEVKGLDRDGDGDHDMDDHEKEKKDEKEAYDNEPEVDVKDVDYMNNKLAGGMNRPKDTFPKVSDGDNPMKRVRETDDFRESIKAELRKRLEEAKGAQ